MKPATGLGPRHTHMGEYAMPNVCRHPLEHQVLEVSGYNDGGLRIVFHEWHCCMCHRVIRRQVGTCDLGRRVWAADMWD